MCSGQESWPGATLSCFDRHCRGLNNAGLGDAELSFYRKLIPSVSYFLPLPFYPLVLVQLSFVAVDETGEVAGYVMAKMDEGG